MKYKIFQWVNKDMSSEFDTYMNYCWIFVDLQTPHYKALSEITTDDAIENGFNNLSECSIAAHVLKDRFPQESFTIQTII